MSTLKADAVTPVTGNTNLSLTGSGTGVVHLGDGALKFPDADGANTQVIQTNGAGQLSFVAAGSGGLVFLATQTASTSATLDFTSVFDASKYNDYYVTFDGILAASSGATLQLTFSTDNGSTWETGSSGDHAYQEVTYGGTASDGGQDSDEVIDICRDCHTAATQQGYLFINAAHSTTDTIVGGMISGVPSAGGYEFRSIFGNRNADDSVTAVRFGFSSGNITSGSIRIHGIVKA
jgi:hypothetical protein